MLRKYLCYAGDKPRTWSQWLAMAEWSYNSSHHTSAKISPFEVLYEYTPPTLLSYIPGTSNNEAVDQLLIDRENVLTLLEQNLITTQNQMKQ